jgi:hypothetical protein
MMEIVAQNRRVRREYSFLEPEDLRQSWHYAAAAVDGERLSVDRVV